MAPSGQTNLAVMDVIVAMQFLQQVLPSFGGDPSKITISGQSSGADMVRALLGADSAAPLFRSAVLQSDPMVCLLLYKLTKSLCDNDALGLWIFVSGDPTNPAKLFQRCYFVRSFQFRVS